WVDLCLSVSWQSVYNEVSTRYEERGAFRRHCLSQTFSSLQPRFRLYDVRSKRHPLVEKCVPYLLEEIALKVAIVRSGLFRGEIMPTPESDLMRAVYAGRYLPLDTRGGSFLVVRHDGEAAVSKDLGVMGGGAPGLSL